MENDCEESLLQNVQVREFLALDQQGPELCLSLLCEDEGLAREGAAEWLWRAVGNR